MATITITEGLAEIKTINARIAKMRETSQPYVARDGRMLDPHAQDGGSHAFIQRQRQAIADLEDRLVYIRSAIQAKNLTMSLQLGTRMRTVAGWLTWRREVSKGASDFLARLFTLVQQARQQGRNANRVVVGPGEQSSGKPENEVVVNLNEAKLAAEMEEMEKLLGDLDGKLSLLNATTTIEVP